MISAENDHNGKWPFKASTIAANCLTCLKMEKKTKTGCKGHVTAQSSGLLNKFNCTFLYFLIDNLLLQLYSHCSASAILRTVTFHTMEMRKPFTRGP